MKLLIENIAKLLQEIGYQRLESRIYKVENQFYKLIDFQQGAHGQYFFVNVCIHPLGLPKLLAGRLEVPTKPLEYECILRRRLDEVSSDSSIAFRSKLVSQNDVQIESLVSILSRDAVAWLDSWGSFQKILLADNAILEAMLTVVPNLKAKACSMLKYFCALKEGTADEAQYYIDHYFSSPSHGYDFSLVDEYLTGIKRS